jgi:cytochrome c biogenesis protein CcmG, thiol:disulfide interchange protein DsbE
MKERESSMGSRILTRTGAPAFALLLLFAASAFASPKATVGREAPEFTLTGLTSDETVTLSELRGKVVFIDFWASWCLPCRQLMPRIAELKEQYPEVEVVAISIDANRDKAITFLRQVEPGLRAVHDRRRRVANLYRVDRMPASFVIDKAGRLRFRHDGYGMQDLETVERQLRLLLEE